MNASHVRYRYHVEVLPPKQDSETLAANLETFAQKYRRVLESGDCACITDNAMGLLSFQGTEMLQELGLPVRPEQVMIHLNTFHTKADLDNILRTCAYLGIRDLLVITGDGSERLPKLRPGDINAEEAASVTSVELLRYIAERYPGTFTLGVAFNPYEPEVHEFDKLQRKIAAGATFVVTQPVIERHPVIDKLLATCTLPVTLEAWMSKKLHLLSQCVGYEIPEDTPFDPLTTLTLLRRTYPQCGMYLSLLGFKTQYDQIAETRTLPHASGVAGSDASGHAAASRQNRPLRIVVCIKQVPATNDASIDPETKRIVREGVKAVLNPFDTYAIEEAVLLREQYGGEVIALSMGPPKAEAVLREAVAQGADRAVLLSHRAFGGSDTWATSYTLACAIRTLGGADLVICGKQAIDGDTAQVGPGIAAHLGWPQATHVMEIRSSAKDRTLVAVRMHEDGYDVCEVTFPAVITVVKDINQPRVPTLKSRLASQHIEIPVWSPDVIGADIAKIGLDGSPTRVVKTEPPPLRQKAVRRITGAPAACAADVLHELRKRSLV